MKILRFCFVTLFTSFLSVVDCQTIHAYDLSPGVFNSTPVPLSSEIDPADGQPVLKFHLNSYIPLSATYYVETKIADLEALRTNTLTLTEFFGANSIALRSTQTGQPIQLFRTCLRFNDQKGILFTQANTTTGKNYLYQTAGKNLVTNLNEQTTLDDLTLIDSIGYFRGNIVFQDKIVISGETPGFGIELLVIDSNYNFQVIDVNNGPAASDAGTFFNRADSVLYFKATNGTDGAELWRTDGTEDGTWQLKDINPGSANSTPKQFTEHNGKVYFVANDGNGDELWITDGSTAGTTKVADLNSTPATGSITNIVSGPGGLLYFTPLDDSGNRRIYKTNGTSAGTSLVSPDIIVASGFVFEDFNNAIYFAGFPVNTQTVRLYKTDGTAVGTTEVYSAYSASSTHYGISLSFRTAISNGRLYFTANDSIHGNEVYKTDGTTAGSSMLADIGDDEFDYPNYLTAIAGGGVFFMSPDSAIGNELYIADLDLPNAIETTKFNNNTLTVFPNPTSGKLTAHLPSGAVGKYQVILTDLTGKVVAEDLISSSDESLQVEHPAYVSTGIYFLSVWNERGESTVLKVVYY